MSPIGVFEEVRYVVEQIVAYLVLLMPFCRKKKYFYLNLILGTIGLSLISLIYFPILEGLELTGLSIHSYKYLIVFYYIVLTYLIMLMFYFCFDIKPNTLFFFGIASYAMQHIVYAFAHELIAMVAWKELSRDNNLLIFYVLISFLVMTLIYGIVYFVFKKDLKKLNTSLFKNKGYTIFFNVFFTFFIVTTFMLQSFFRIIDSSGKTVELNYVACISQVAVCLFALTIIKFTIKFIDESKEKEIANQLLMTQRKQYEFSKNNIEIINRKCHDMKHQINALKFINEEEKEKAFDNISKTIVFYDCQVNTKNKALEIILNEKNLIASDKKIKVNVSVDKSIELKKIDVIDIYTLFGNILDNAIEGTDKLEAEKKIINLQIFKKDNFIVIKEYNYYKDIVKDKNNNIITSKKDSINHGFGLKSISEIAKKYKGTLTIDLSNNVFSLTIVLPFMLLN